MESSSFVGCTDMAFPQTRSKSWQTAGKVECEGIQYRL